MPLLNLAIPSKSAEVRAPHPQMKFVFLALAVVLGLVASVVFVTNRKESVTHQPEPPTVNFNVKDFPEHGVLLIAPSHPAFKELRSKLTKSESLIDNSYSVFLRNTGNRAVVGYFIRWECFDEKGEIPTRNLSNDRNVSNIVSWVFLYGEESDRKAAMNRSTDIIKPQSIWFISFDYPSGPIEQVAGDAVFAQPKSIDAAPRNSCASVSVIADGIFFDDGTFIGPDTNGFFTSTKGQMDARYEILRGIQTQLKLGKKAEEVFKGLERIRDHERAKQGERNTEDEFRSYFKSMFAQDVLGKKEVLGADKTLEDVQLQLSKPWVNLRKL